jgi:hypothetical protein
MLDLGDKDDVLDSLQLKTATYRNNELKWLIKEDVPIDRHDFPELRSSADVKEVNIPGFPQSSSTDGR